MSPSIDIDDKTVGRLQKIAVPLTDTFNSVINRILDTYEAVHAVEATNVKSGTSLGTTPQGAMRFDPANPPQLKFTTCVRITVDGELFPKQTTFWNNLLIGVIQKVASKGHDAKAIHSMMTIANSVPGKREDSGYKFIASVGLSVQGAEANAAFKQAHQLAIANGVSFSVEFFWQDNERAAHPNQRGYIEV